MLLSPLPISRRKPPFGFPFGGRSSMHAAVHADPASLPAAREIRAAGGILRPAPAMHAPIMEVAWLPQSRALAASKLATAHRKDGARTAEGTREAGLAFPRHPSRCQAVYLALLVAEWAVSAFGVILQPMQDACFDPRSDERAHLRRGSLGGRGGRLSRGAADCPAAFSPLQ